jgi:hypothetical protein
VEVSGTIRLKPAKNYAHKRNIKWKGEIFLKPIFHRWLIIQYLRVSAWEEGKSDIFSLLVSGSGIFAKQRTAENSSAALCVAKI